MKPVQEVKKPRGIGSMEPGHEHEFEPELGLPEPLPAGEALLWQGSPDWRLLARRAFHVRALAAYFAAVLALRAAAVLAPGLHGEAGGSWADASHAVIVLAPLPLAALGFVLIFAWLAAKTSVYTVTDQRVVMRIGIVLGVTFNLPYKAIASADVRRDANGHGDIPLKLDRGAHGGRIAIVHLWPHCRPWRLANPEPMLRCVPDAARVARLIAEAWAAATGNAAVPATASTEASRGYSSPARVSPTTGLSAR